MLAAEKLGSLSVCVQVFSLREEQFKDLYRLFHPDVS